jgi:hypothetical protein
MSGEKLIISELDDDYEEDEESHASDTPNAQVEEGRTELKNQKIIVTELDNDDEEDDEVHATETTPPVDHRNGAGESHAEVPKYIAEQAMPESSAEVPKENKDHAMPESNNQISNDGSCAVLPNKTEVLEPVPVHMISAETSESGAVIGAIVICFLTGFVFFLLHNIVRRLRRAKTLRGQNNQIQVGGWVDL